MTFFCFLLKKTVEIKWLEEPLRILGYPNSDNFNISVIMWSFPEWLFPFKILIHLANSAQICLYPHSETCLFLWTELYQAPLQGEKTTTQILSTHNQIPVVSSHLLAISYVTGSLWCSCCEPLAENWKSTMNHIHMSCCKFIQKDSYLIEKASINIYFLIGKISCIPKRKKKKKKRWSFQFSAERMLSAAVSSTASRVSPRWSCSFVGLYGLQHKR